MDVETLKEFAVTGASLIALGTADGQPAHAVGFTYPAAYDSGSTWIYSYALSND